MRLRALYLFILMVGIGILQATLPTDRERMELKGPVQQYTVSVPECDITHYFFDQEGNLQKISTENFWESAKPLYMVERELDESGNLRRLVLRTESGDLIPYQSFTYYLEGALMRLAKHTWYDDSYIEEYFDESGKLLITKWFSNNQSLRTEVVNEYNELGQLISETAYSPDSDYESNSAYDRRSTFQMDSQGRIIRKETRLRISGKTIEVLHYQYDTQGRIEKIIHDSSEEGRWEDEFNYDQYGNLRGLSGGMEGSSTPSYTYEYYPD